MAFFFFLQLQTRLFHRKRNHFSKLNLASCNPWMTRLVPANFLSQRWSARIRSLLDLLWKSVCCSYVIFNWMLSSCLSFFGVLLFYGVLFFKALVAEFLYWSKHWFKAHSFVILLLSASIPGGITIVQKQNHSLLQCSHFSSIWPWGTGHLCGTSSEYSAPSLAIRFYHQK